MKRFVLLSFLFLSAVTFQSCELESTDEQAGLIENTDAELIENAENLPKDFHSVDPDEVEDPDDRGNN